MGLPPIKSTFPIRIPSLFPDYPHSIPHFHPAGKPAHRRPPTRDKKELTALQPLTDGILREAFAADNWLIDQDIPDYLRHYDPVFHADEEAMFPSGYPEAGRGILYLRGYLTRPMEENRLCAGISAADIRAALDAAGHRLGQPA